MNLIMIVLLRTCLISHNISTIADHYHVNYNTVRNVAKAGITEISLVLHDQTSTDVMVKEII